MRILSEVDGDEVSLVKRAANKRRFLLLKGDTVDAELNDILDVPYGREGAMLDEVRKDCVDETVEKAVVYAIRLLKGVESELSPETIEKLGRELYPKQNKALNTTGGVAADGDLTGSASSETPADYEGDASGPDKDGSCSGDDLEGSASGVELADDNDEDDVKKEDGGVSRVSSWLKRSKEAKASSESSTDLSKAEDTNDEERGTVEIPVPIRKEDGTWDLSGVPEESRPFFSEMIEKADRTASELAEAKEQLAKSDDSLLTRRMVEKAARFNHVAATDDLAPVLKEASQKLDPETFEKLESVLKTAQERIEKGDLFTEHGRASGHGTDQPNDAYSQLVEKANEMVEKSGDITFESAFDKAMMSNPALYDRYVAERGWGN